MDIPGKVRGFISSNFYVPEGFRLEDRTSLFEVGIIDSTGVLEVIQFVEREFGVQVEDWEVHPDNLDSIDRITSFVSRKLTRLAV
ncbi:MAG: acyl carrier protein [Myxococcales bacterium]